MLRRQALSAISFSFLGGAVLPSLTFGSEAAGAVSARSALVSQLQALQTLLAAEVCSTDAVSECQALADESLFRLSQHQPLSAAFCQSLADAVMRVANSTESPQSPPVRLGTVHGLFLRNLHQQLLDTVWEIAQPLAA